MKTSINYLPEQKRDDLRRIVECVLEVLPDCEMIILYGSYARNTYVDYDQRIEYGIRTCFMSDYDIFGSYQYPFPKIYYQSHLEQGHR